MENRAVVACFLRHDEAVLLLRRSANVGSYPGEWGAVAGHADGDPAAAMRREIREQTGFAESDVALVRRSDPLTVTDDELGVQWTVHPALFDCDRRDVSPNWETDAAEWVSPTAVLHRETVPDLWRSYDRVRPTVETVATDREHGAAYVSIRALEVLRDEAALLAAAASAIDGDSERTVSDSERAADDGEAADESGAGSDWDRIASTARDLLAARPSMSVVRNRVNRVMHAASAVRTAAAVEHAASTAVAHAVTADRRAAERAGERVAGQRVATLSRSGTVCTALASGEPEAVLVAESRPGGEGVGTAASLAAAADVTLTGDAAFAHALAEWGADVLLVGADTVLADGRVVNKAGTRAAAIASSSEGVDVLVAAAADKLSSENGTVDLEPRAASELYDGDADLSVLNPTFDVTPSDCIDAVITERGTLDADAVREIARRHSDLAAWDGES